MLRLLVDPSVRIVIVRGNNLGQVLADPEELGQVMMNLAKNANDAMRDGGVLTIATANAHLGEAGGVEYPTPRQGKYVILRVSDTGVGMEAETSKRMFEPLFTTKGVGEGTGLGLSIVSEIVRHSGGTISATSTPGHGTEFTIHLPQYDAGAPDGGGNGESAAGERQGDVS
jgi:signal transduction histidine kinase